MFFCFLFFWSETFTFQISEMETNYVDPVDIPRWCSRLSRMTVRCHSNQGVSFYVLISIWFPFLGFNTSIFLTTLSFGFSIIDPYIPFFVMKIGERVGSYRIGKKISRPLMYWAIDIPGTCANIPYHHKRRVIETLEKLRLSERLYLRQLGSLFGNHFWKMWHRNTEKRSIILNYFILHGQV